MGRHDGVLVVLLLWFFTLATTKLCFCDGNPNVVCRGEERKALLSFKQGLDNPLNRLSSWTATDCCTWKGVGCDNTTGHVVKLNLTWSDLGGEVSDSLLDLKHLHYIDLSNNHFGGHIPKFIGSLTNLRYLDLSFNDEGFSGVIPLQLGNLSSLRHLNIGWNYLTVEDVGWISRLPYLQFLDMSGIDLSKAPNWRQVMNTLPSLSELHLSQCGIHNIAPLRHVNFSSLVVLDLSANNIIFSKLESWFSSLGSLVELDLSGNDFHGPIPITLQNMSALRLLDLSYNNFNSTLPEFLYNLTSLEILLLSTNNFQGELSIAIGTLISLTELDLSYNYLQGEIPETMGDLFNLQELDVSYNQLNGTIPGGLGHLSKLTYLDISHNFLKGVVSEVHFSNLTRLKMFSASSNMLTLKVSSNWIPPFQLKTVQMESWQLGPRFPAWLRTQKDCWFLDLSNAKISDVIPTWFWSLSRIDHLNLSHNHIHGNIPTLPFGSTIFLGSNKLSGPVPQVSSGIIYLDLSNNSLNGSLSPMFCQRLELGKMLGILNFSMLGMLDLSTNLLSGELPDCWMNWIQLKVLKLRNNNLTGKIPSSMGSLLWLESLNLRNNSLSGKLPLSLQNCTDLIDLDLSENEFSGTIPMWIGSMVHLKVLALRSNKLSGRIPLGLCSLNSLQILDLADNNVLGIIPQCLGNFSAMTKQQTSSGHISYEVYATEFVETASLVMKRMKYEYSSTLSLVTSIDLSCNSLSGEIPEEVTSLYGLRFLNLSKNHLHGKIPENISAMKLLESLDLSMNQLSGVIPQGMAALSFLGHLNLSYNKFFGKIPSGTQLQTFSPLSFIGNHELCGLPLTVNCSRSDGPQHQTPKANDQNDEDREWIDMKWFYMSLPFGFAVGFWCVCGPLAFNKAWRYAYFRFLDDIEYKLWRLFHNCKFP